MTIKGLNLIFRNSIETLRNSGFKDGTTQIFKSVREEGGKTSAIFCGLGFVTGCIVPCTIISAPVLGYTGAILGKVLSGSAKAGVQYVRKNLNCLF